MRFSHHLGVERNILRRRRREQDAVRGEHRADRIGISRHKGDCEKLIVDRRPNHPAQPGRITVARRAFFKPAAAIVEPIVFNVLRLVPVEPEHPHQSHVIPGPHGRGGADADLLFRERHVLPGSIFNANASDDLIIAAEIELLHNAQTGRQRFLCSDRGPRGAGELELVIRQCVTSSHRQHRDTGVVIEGGELIGARRLVTSDRFQETLELNLFETTAARGEEVNRVGCFQSLYLLGEIRRQNDGLSRGGYKGWLRRRGTVKRRR